MHNIGFSTGALAYGDFRRGLALQELPGVTAVELSALREQELPILVDALDSLDLSQFPYCSFHAPSALNSLSVSEVLEQLQRVAADNIPIVVHPDILGEDLKPWRVLGEHLLLENMDLRKPVCRTAVEMQPFFDELPEARFCFDIGHARLIDPTMSVAVELLLAFRDRLAELHISEVNWECRHIRIGSAAATAFQSVAKWIPSSLPVIIESGITESEIQRELEVVRKCLNEKSPILTEPVTSSTVT